MATVKKTIGRLPVYKGDWVAGTYSMLNQVAYLGSTFQSKIDNNTSQPATVVNNALQVNANWSVVSNGTAAYLADARLTAVEGEADKLDAKIATKANQSDLVQLEQELNYDIVGAESYTDNKLFNYIAIKNGHYVMSDGKLNPTIDNLAYYTDKIPVRLGDNFNYTGKAAYNNTCVYVMYSITGAVIEYDKTEGDYIDRVVSISNSNVSHIRFSSYITVPVIRRMTTGKTMQTYVDESISIVNDRIDGMDAFKSKIYNLYNPADSTIGKYIQDGLLRDNSSSITSGFISVLNGNTYTFPVDLSLFGANMAAKISSFDDNYKYIGNITGVLNGIMLTITVSNTNIKYIRTTLSNRPRYQYKWGESADTYMIVNSDTYPNRYYTYGEITEYPNGELPASINAMTNPLFGKSVIFNGDSICHANDDTNKYGWAGRIGTKNNMMWQNWAVGGGSFTNGGWGNYVITDRDFGDANPDYIIIEGGTNDADRIGSILSGGNPANYGTLSLTGYDGNYTNDTYCGAIEFLFKKLLTNYPKAKIGVIIAQKMGVSNDYTPAGNNRRAYFDTLMKLCVKWGIPYINLWDTARINPKLSIYYTSGGVDNYYTDGQHLTPKGYEVITPMIEEWMKTI